MKLTDLQCRTLPPGKYADGNGLTLVVRPTGMRQFSMRVQISGKDIVRKLGNYPDMGLSTARTIAAQQHRDLSAGRPVTFVGKPPVILRKRAQPNAAAMGFDLAADREATRAELAGRSFGDWCQLWVIAHTAEQVWKPGHREKTMGRINRFLVASPLWNEPLTGIKAPDVSLLLDSLHFGTHPLLQGRAQRDTAEKLRGIIGGVFRFAMGKGAEDVKDPTGLIVVGSGKKTKQKNLASILDLNVLGEILRRVHGAQYITQPVRSAITLLAYTAQRPGMIAAAKWAHFHLDDAEPVWIIPREDMKVDDNGGEQPREDHVVPLAPEVVAILRAMPRPENAVYVFPGSQGREHLGEDAMPKTFRDSLGLRGKMVPHGWRSAFSTWAHGQHNPDGAERFPYYVVELCLDHETRNKVQLAYHQTRPLPAMRLVMEAWAAELNRAQRGEHVAVPKHIEVRHADTFQVIDARPAPRPRGRPRTRNVNQE